MNQGPAGKPRILHGIRLFVICFVFYFPILLCAVGALKLLNPLQFGHRPELIVVYNAGFLLGTTLAVLCFSYGQATPDRPRNRKRVVLAGEFFALGSLLFLIASVIWYAAIAADGGNPFVEPWPKEPPPNASWLLPVSQLFCFIAAVLSHFALFLLVHVLVGRCGFRRDGDFGRLDDVPTEE